MGGDGDQIYDSEMIKKEPCSYTFKEVIIHPTLDYSVLKNRLKQQTNIDDGRTRKGAKMLKIDRCVTSCDGIEATISSN